MNGSGAAIHCSSQDLRRFYGASRLNLCPIHDRTGLQGSGRQHVCRWEERAATWRIEVIRLIDNVEAGEAMSVPYSIKARSISFKAKPSESSEVMEEFIPKEGLAALLMLGSH